MIWFTSDHHFGDEKALIYRTRPFDSVDEMNNHMVTEWNKLILPDDTVYYLGDFSVSDEGVEEFIPQLNGQKKLIMGNHDCNRSKDLLKEYFIYISQDPIILNIDGDKLWLCHYPLQRDDPNKEGSLYTVCGHIHDAFKVARRMVNIGVDAWHFRPVSLSQVLKCRNSEEEGRWDANVYPDAPLKWQWEVSNIRERSVVEPTMKILTKQMEESGLI